jgi:protoporphyrinogen oxidase
MHVVVLGAGLAGLSAAYELLRAGHRVTVLERDDFPGGMASSWEVDGFWLDHGPHRFHSRDEELIRHLYTVLDDKVIVRERLSRIFMQGKFFDYPLKTKNVLVSLPPHLLVRAIWDYVWIRMKTLFVKIPDDNFENWVLKRFGRTLYDMFFGTYTSKAWKMPCTEISADWASQRISQANLWDTIKKTLRPPKAGESRSLVSEFWYPSEGGIGEIGRGYARKVEELGGEILYEAQVTTVQIEGGRAQRVGHTGPDGAEQFVECDHLVNTIPLPRLLETFTPAVEPEVTSALAGLRYLGIVFVYLEVDQPQVSPDHWVYLPEKHLTVHRISEFKNFNPDAGPPDKTAVCCEITCLPGDETWNLSIEEAARIAERDLKTVGLLAEDTHTRALDLHRLPNAYPVYDLTYKQNLAVLRGAVKDVENLETTGRQGLYRYNNMDHSIAMGRRVAKTLAEGVDARAEAVATGEEYFG